MTSLRTLTALAAAAMVSLSAAPAAFANTTPVGSSGGTPSANICLLSFDCTYVNYKHGQPTDVVKHTGTLVNWSLNAGSVGGQVQLRVLRPLGHGRFTFVHSSSVQTVTATGENTFGAHIKVKAGDVLALSDASSGLYMASAPAGTCVRYFDSSVPDGWSGKPDQNAPQLHLLLSANITP